ncbi:hypothetical protein MANES_04G047409v8 [Manihot esculenta]|uniref:Uncharacterized protein n=1 Tax=Manihot esculenta TaxID=3983 RepID=A0ACC8DQD4_MANES|nr:hypothetical protein MANES_04G047409v8 [Manihot esculenta]
MLKPRVDANNFELKPSLVQMVQQSQFSGNPTESPHLHLSNFMEISILMGKTEDDAYACLDKIAYNNYLWNSERANVKSEAKKPAGMFEIEVMSMINAKFDALARRMDMMKANNVNALNDMSYGSSFGYDNQSWGQEFSAEKINYVNNYRQKSMGMDQKMLENQIAQQASSSSKAQEKLPSVHRVQDRLTTGLGGLKPIWILVPSSLGRYREGTGFRAVTPSQPKNPRECKAVHLRSGKVVGDESEKKSEVEKKEKEDEKEKCVEGEKYERKDDSKEERKDEFIEMKARFLEVFKKLYVNIPFIDALFQMSSYAKFLKDILSNKRLEEYETVALIGDCSALLQNKLPPKLKDSGSFSIPCQIGEINIGKTLCGESVSLLPLPIFEKLKIGDLKPTTISLQLADRSIKYLIGISAWKPLKVDKFFIPIDFVLLKMEEDINILIILGRPFLATARAIIDVKNRRLKLKVGEEDVEFYLFEPKAPNTLSTSSSCLRVDVLENDEISVAFIMLFEDNNYILHSQEQNLEEGIKEQD